MIDISDSVTGSHHLPFQGFGKLWPRMVENAIPHFPSQIKFFQMIYNPQALFVMPKSPGMDAIQLFFSSMAKGRMPQIVPKGNGFGQVLIESQSPGRCSGNLSHLQGMGESSPIVIALGSNKNLGFML